MIDDDEDRFNLRAVHLPYPRPYGADASMAAQMGSTASLDDDFHSPVDSDDKEEEEEGVLERIEDAFGLKHARTDTEDLAWMISIGELIGKI